MILRGLSRPMALCVVFAAAFAVAVVLGPIVMLPMIFEEPRVVEGYLRYLGYLGALEWVEDLDTVGFWVIVGIGSIWAGLQVLFLSPIVGRPRLESQGRSLVPSLVAAAVLGAFMCSLLWASAVEGVCAALALNEERFSQDFGGIVVVGYITANAVWIGGGFAWYMLLSHAGSMRNPAGLDRFVRWIFAGTCVELLLGVVFYLQVRRKTDCYCAMMSFWNLVFGLATLLWMCGPWAVLLLTRGERLQWARGACARCGYPRRTDAEVCTECGARHAPAGVQR